MKNIEKVVDSLMEHLVFNNYNVPHHIHYTYLEDDDLEIGFDLGVNARKYLSISPTFDPKYQEFINEIEKKIYNALRYVNLQSKFQSINYYYYEKSIFTEIENDLNEKLFIALNETYNITKQEMEESEIYFQVLEVEGNWVGVKLYLYGQEVVLDSENKTLKISCRDLMNKMFEIADTFDLFYTDIENYVCT